MAARAKIQDELIATLRAQLDVAHVDIDTHCSAIAAHRLMIDEQSRLLTRRDARIELLEQQLNALKRRLFGAHSEKLSPGQLALWRSEQQEDHAAIEAELEQLVPSDEVAAKVHPKRPVELPAHLPRKTRTLDVAPICECCGGALHRIGEERTQSIEWIPGHFEAHEVLRPKYACRGCETVTTAPLPPRVNAKCLLGESVVAQVLVSKYDDHVPLHRQQKIFRRHGVDIPESTLGDVTGRSAWALTPLADRLATLITTQGKLHADDTPVTVLVPEGTGTVRKEGRFWAYCLDQSLHDPSVKPMVVFRFSPGRSGQYPQAFLKDFTGYLQADAFAGFAPLFVSGKVKEVACWAHARRKFDELKAAPIAKTILLRIGTLYQIEREVRGLPPDDIAARRQAAALPLLNELKQYLDEKLLALSNASALAQAIGYLTKRWPSFCRYVEHGALAIDNNAVERAIRPIAIGRKNWNLLGSIAAGERAAVLYSLIGTCSLNGIEPWSYLTDVLARLPTCLAKDIDQLLPMNWQPRDIPPT